MDIKTIQGELVKRGLYSGSIDGLNGPGTMGGIEKALSSIPHQGWPDSRKLVAFEQLVYQNAGWPGGVDGLVGPQTLSNRQRYASLDKVTTSAPSQKPPVISTSGTIVPRVVDVYHGDVLRSFQPAAAAGIWGCIHKSSQNVKDDAYDERRKLAKQIPDFLWGAYHFNTAQETKAQVDLFLSAAKPDDDTLMVLDYEANAKSDMHIHQLVDFMHLLQEKLGRKGAIYSGNKIKETIGDLGPEDFAYITSHRLWLCQYGNHRVLPKGFSRTWLWQYTGDGLGPMPHYVPGITVPGGKGIDLSVFDGTQEELTASWA